MEKCWIDVGDEAECEACQGNADADWIPYDEPFPDGSDTAEDSHPGCRCSTGYQPVSTSSNAQD